MASFGTLSKLYYNFSDKKLKKRVARHFNLPQHEVLESWMRSLTVLRNCCAHHSRLWNRYLSTAPQMKASLRGAWVNIEKIDSNKVYAILCCIAYWLDSMGYASDFKSNLKSLFNTYTQVDPAAMGFPDNWDSEPLWR
ncbi:MAG: Abi family protein [Muribaculaceae bacterium]